jgi:hypothetical protein
VPLALLGGGGISRLHERACHARRGEDERLAPRKDKISTLATSIVMPAKAGIQDSERDATELMPCLVARGGGRSIIRFRG